jgi:phenylalanyl-tRNA synthetase alpha chain
MEAELDQLLNEALGDLDQVKDETALETARIKYLGKKGLLAELAAGMRSVAPENKKAVGQRLNEVRTAITTRLEETRTTLQQEADVAALSGLDPTLPGRGHHVGSLHPLSIILDEAVSALRRLGFAVADGPEIESEFHCFDALNTPMDHPARNEKDTFYFDDGNLLRTHTSSVQIRAMEKARATPLRIIAPGSAFRRDEIDATHLSCFNQLEGLFVDQEVNLADLKGTLEYFFRCLFGKETQTRFRPHFFPFTEPSYEIDILLQSAGRKARWIEIAGCGIVDPAVFEAVCEARGDNLFDPDRVSGFAFGMGLERLAMIRWGIADIRLLIENDIRFLGQFA